MATGSTDSTTASADVSGELVTLLEGEAPVTVLACPAPRQLLAAATIAVESAAPIHLRVVGPGRPAIDATDSGVVTTAPGLCDADVTLSPYTPLADVEAIGESRTGVLGDAVTAIQSVGSEPAAGVVLTHDELATGLAESIRVDVPEEALDDLDGSLTALDEAEVRSLTSWLVGTILETDRPDGVAAAIQTALAPTYVEAGPAPTAEGTADIVATVAEAEPGVLLASLLDDRGWDDIVDAYQRAVADVTETVETLPTGEQAEIASATIEDVAMVPTTRRWASRTLEAPYGLLVAGDGPTQLTLVATGERSASAVLETVANRRDGTSWGDPFVASVLLSDQPADPQHVIARAL